MTVEQRLENIPFPDPTAVTGTDMPVDCQMKIPKTVYMSEE